MRCTVAAARRLIVSFAKVFEVPQARSTAEVTMRRGHRDSRWLAVSRSSDFAVLGWLEALRSLRLAWVAGYFLTGTVAGATTIAGILILVALAGPLYTWRYVIAPDSHIATLY